MSSHGGGRIEYGGRFSDPDSRLSEAFEVFREADRRSGNNVMSLFDNRTRLVLSSNEDRRAYGSTSMHVYHSGQWHNVDSASPDVWSRASHRAPVEVRMNISRDLETHEMHETISHEMTLHAEQFADFARREIRDRDNSSSAIARRWRRWSQPGGWLNVDNQHGELVDNNSHSMRNSMLEVSRIIRHGDRGIHKRTYDRSRRRRHKLARKIQEEWHTDRKQHRRQRLGGRSPSPYVYRHRGRQQRLRATNPY